MKTEKKTAKLFMNGRSQAIRLPKEFRMDGNEVCVQKSGNTLIITPLSDRESWDEWFADFNMMQSSAIEREQPQMQQERETFDDIA